ncbi:hypothetical protein J3F84DRAFT_371321 [Trichoderma pleuroticola]
MRVPDAVDRGALQDGARSAPNLLEKWARGHSCPSPSLLCVCHAGFTISHLSSFHMILSFSRHPFISSISQDRGEHRMLCVCAAVTRRCAWRCLLGIHTNMNPVCPCACSFHASQRLGMLQAAGFVVHTTPPRTGRRNCAGQDEAKSASPHETPQGICTAKLLTEYMYRPSSATPVLHRKKELFRSPTPYPRITHTKYAARLINCLVSQGVSPSLALVISVGLYCISDLQGHFPLSQKVAEQVQGFPFVIHVPPCCCNQFKSNQMSALGLTA